MEKVLDCKKYVEEEKNKIKELNIKPTLVVIKASDDLSSNLYMKSKKVLCDELGFNFILYEYKSYALENEIIDKIKELNNNKDVNGIIIQLPIYNHLNKNKIINTINPIKDIDGLTIINKGLLEEGNAIHTPCTALGIINILKYYNIGSEGKNITLLGRSELVGIPLSKLLIKSNATVTICHSKTLDITKYTKDADILISAIGEPKYITNNMIKDKSILIDVGISKINNKIYGDIDFDNVIDKCEYITKVPGGIGIITTITLMKNLVNAYLYMRKE